MAAPHRPLPSPPRLRGIFYTDRWSSGILPRCPRTTVLLLVSNYTPRGEWRCECQEPVKFAFQVYLAHSCRARSPQILSVFEDNTSRINLKSRSRLSCRRKPICLLICRYLSFGSERLSEAADEKKEARLLYCK